MYHYITRNGTIIYMTWVGILISLCVFLFVLKWYTKQYRLNLKHFIQLLPFYGMFIYALWSYSYYFIEYGRIIPLTIAEFLEYFSPQWYTFHFVGLIIWIALCLYHFFIKHVESLQAKQRRDSILHAAALACIPLWLFLLLGDNFIWETTEGVFYISAILPDSKVATYGKVLPLWIFLSCAWLLIHLYMYLMTKKSNTSTDKIIAHRKDRTYSGIALFCLFLLIITLFQIYPRYFVIEILWRTFDIKQYILLGYIIYFTILHIKNNKSL